MSMNVMDETDVSVRPQLVKTQILVISVNAWMAIDALIKHHVLVRPNCSHY